MNPKGKDGLHRRDPKFATCRSYSRSANLPGTGWDPQAASCTKQSNLLTKLEKRDPVFS
jgi:hypothetical protein